MSRIDITPNGLKGRTPAIRVYREEGRVVVLWRERRQRRYRTYPDTPAGRIDAVGYAKGVFDGLSAPAKPEGALTTSQLWDAYIAAEGTSLRPRSVILYAQRWRRWQLFIGATSIAEDVQTKDVADFRAADSRRHAINQVRAVIRVVKLVYAWADRMDLISRNRVARYVFKQGKDETVHQPPEYRRADWDALLAELGGGQDTRRWRAWAVMMLAGSQGERVRAILHLTWADIDLAAGLIRWPKATNKQGRDRAQPLTWEAYSAILTAWARGPECEGYLFTGRDGKPYTYQAFWYHLRAAEQRAGVVHAKWRAAHGLRRMAAGNVAEATGDPWLALQWIGDTDPRRAKEYLKERQERMQQAAEAATGCHTGAIKTKKSHEPTAPNRLPRNRMAKEPLVGFEPTTACVEKTANSPQDQASQGVAPHRTNPEAPRSAPESRGLGAIKVPQNTEGVA